MVLDIYKALRLDSQHMIKHFWHNQKPFPVFMDVKSLLWPPLLVTDCLWDLQQIGSRFKHKYFVSQLYFDI